MKHLVIVFLLASFTWAVDLSQLSLQQRAILESLPAEQKAKALSGLAGSPQADKEKASLLLPKEKAKTKVKTIHVESPKLIRYTQNILNNALPSSFSSTTNAVGSDYPLKAGDAIVVSIWGGPEKEMRLSLNNKGAVFIKNGGWVSLNGLTLYGAQQKITKVLKKSIVGIELGTTEIKVRLDELSPIKVFVLGEVVRPGGYSFHGNTNVMMALYEAQGPTDIGSVRNIQITRGSRKLKVDLYDYLLGGKRPKYNILKDGDIIYLPVASKLVMATGEVGREAIFELKEKEILKDLIKMAGNVNFNAAKSSATIHRIEEDGAKVIENIGDLSDAAKMNLSHGDSLFVFTSAEEVDAKVEVEGFIKYPGIYAFEPQMTIARLVEIAGGPKSEAFAERVMVYRENEDGSNTTLAGKIDASLTLEPKDLVVIFSKDSMLARDSIRIAGWVKKELAIPFSGGITVKDMVLLAGGFKVGHKAGEAKIERLVDSEKAVEVIPVSLNEDFSNRESQLVLKAGDRVIIPNDPLKHKQELVTLEGAFVHPGKFAILSQKETLLNFMQRLGQKETSAYLGGAQFYRLRQVRKKFINEDSTFTFRDVEELRQINVDFEQVMSGGRGSEINLRDGDKIFMPRQAISVSVEGEVVDPGEVLYREGMSPEEYIAGAGGFTRLSDEDRVVVIYANGTKVPLDGAGKPLDPGSRIVVPDKPEDPPIDWLGGFQAVASILASFASVALTIVLISDSGSSN